MSERKEKNYMAYRKCRCRPAMEKKAGLAAHGYKAVRFAVESVDEASGEFSGYASTFGNLDDGGDIIEPGAFARTIREDFGRIKILSQHNDYDLPIGRPIELREDEKGLFIRAKISDTQKGRDIQTLLKDGVLNELSIGYDAVSFDFDSEKGIRHLKEVRLWEISVVTWAMNREATIDEVKSLAESLRTEVKAGRITRTRMDALKPFIAVVRELVDILSPFLDTPPAPAGDPGEPDTAGTQKGKKVPAKETKKNQETGIVFEIIP